ncbi:pseudouridine synthase [Loktanella sp. R86503]|uniref:pseudouridine synthase n=1 Tax=Loktanella sp. R86503 TaxID=3093847 RepID=UPI0036DD3BA2
MSNTPPEGDRIAKVLSRAGIASRRDAERMITEGRVSVNGKTITSPALNVTDRDRIVVDGKPVGQPEAARLWLYHKPAGLVTSARDEKDRATVFDNLPGDMPRVMSVGRLDINSEGLLLLTNDGGIKRRLELPSTGWLRRYRVRINGSVSEARLDELRKGITVDGVDYQPMLVTFDRQQGANAWLTISIREGKNREIRRAMEAVNATVNRLIRVSYGPFQLGKLAEGAVEEVKGRVLREQLGLEAPEPQKARVRKPLTRVMKPGAGPAKDAPAKGAAGRPGAPRTGGPRPAAPKRGLRKD